MGCVKSTLGERLLSEFWIRSAVIFSIRAVTILCWKIYKFDKKSFTPISKSKTRKQTKDNYLAKIKLKIGSRKFSRLERDQGSAALGVFFLVMRDSGFSLSGWIYRFPEQPYWLDVLKVLSNWKLFELKMLDFSDRI